MNVLTSFDPGARLVVGHRGAAARVPENTLAAFDHAVSLGVDAIEFDVRVTGDGVAVVIHDPTLDRTTSGSGAVSTQSARDVTRADAGARFSPDGQTFPFAGQGLVVPTLDEVLGRYGGLPMLIELKVREAAPEALRLFRRHGCEGRVVVDSFDVRALRPFRGSKVAVGAAKSDVISLAWRSAVRLAPRSLPYSALCIPERYGSMTVPVARLARVAASRGAPTHVWTVNEAAAARRLWGQGVIGIISDDPALILDLRRSLAQTAN